MLPTLDRTHGARCFCTFFLAPFSLLSARAAARNRLSHLFVLLIAPTLCAQTTPVEEYNDPYNSAVLGGSSASYVQEDEKRIESAQVVGTLGESLFGEEVNFHTAVTRRAIERGLTRTDSGQLIAVEELLQDCALNA